MYQQEILNYGEIDLSARRTEIQVSVSKVDDDGHGESYDDGESEYCAVIRTALGSAK